MKKLAVYCIIKPWFRLQAWFNSDKTWHIKLWLIYLQQYFHAPIKYKFTFLLSKQTSCSRFVRKWSGNNSSPHWDGKDEPTVNGKRKTAEWKEEQMSCLVGGCVCSLQPLGNPLTTSVILRVKMTWANLQRTKGERNNNWPPFQTKGFKSRSRGRDLSVCLWYGDDVFCAPSLKKKITRQGLKQILTEQKKRRGVTQTFVFDFCTGCMTNQEIWFMLISWG